MTLRVLFAGALTALPLVVSGAMAQTPPAVTISPAPSANSPSPAAPRRLRRRPHQARRARLRQFQRISLPQRLLQRRRPIQRSHQTRLKGSQALSCPRRRRRRQRGRIPRLALPRPGLRPFPLRPSLRRSRRRSRRRARPRSATIPAQPFSPTPSSPPPRRPSAIRRSWTRAAGQPTSLRSAPERRVRR